MTRGKAHFVVVEVTALSSLLLYCYCCIVDVNIKCVASYSCIYYYACLCYLCVGLLLVLALSTFNTYFDGMFSLK